jgi:hypothetical protein
LETRLDSKERVQYHDSKSDSKKRERERERENEIRENQRALPEGTLGQPTTITPAAWGVVAPLYILSHNALSFSWLGSISSSSSRL